MAVDKKNIFLSHTAAPYPYSSESHPVKKKYPQRDPAAHAAYIQRKLSEAYAAHNLTQIPFCLLLPVALWQRLLKTCLV